MEKSQKLKNEKKNFKHLLLLIFWPLYLISFYIAERVFILDYISVSSSIDKFIPFCEFFIIPYVFWYLFLFFISVYTLFCDVSAFKKFMWFLIITFGISTVIFLVVPTEQLLRPSEFESEGFFINAVQFLYQIDTNTNVCPSLHVVGSFGVLFTAWNAKGLNTVFYRTLFTIITLLITASTVFLKQHSIIDVLVGIAFSFLVLPIVYWLPDKIKKNREKEAD